MSSDRVGVAVSPRELAGSVVEALNLEDVDPAQLNVEVPLFGKGLGLDSLDILEVAMVIQQRYGMKLRAEDPTMKPCSPRCKASPITKRAQARRT